jgi:hypothetical protein
MAVTPTRVLPVTVPGAERYTVTDVLFDSSYPTGGEPLTASDLGLTTVAWAVSSIKTAGTGSVTDVFYDITNSKLKAYAAAAEIANTTDLSAVSAQVVAFGK